MGLSRKEMKKELGKGGHNFTDWRKNGKCIFYVHPSSTIEKRSSLYLRAVVKNADGEEEIRSVRRLYTGDNDPAKLFRLWLEEDDQYDLDDVILRAKTKGGDVEEFTKGDLLGHDDYDWRKNILRVSREALLCVVNVTEKGDPPTEPEILALKISCYKKLDKVWDGEIEEVGEEEGDPWNNPYPCKVTYDPSEQGTNMYDAGTVRHKVRPLTNEVRAVLGMPAIDMSPYVDPSQESTPEGTTLQILRKLCVVSCPVLGSDVEAETPEETEEPKTKRGRPKGSKNKPKQQEPEEEASEEDEAEHVRPRPPSRPTPKPETEKGTVLVENAKPGWYEYQGDRVKLLRYSSTNNVGHMEDDDGDEFDVPPGTVLKLVKEETEAETEEQEAPAGMVARDCEVGETYYLRDGRKVTFKRYKASKDQTVFEDEKGERVFVDGSDPVSHDEQDKPVHVAEKEEVRQTKPKSRVQEPKPEEEEDDDGEEVECPTCDSPLEEREDGYWCAKCKVLYEAEADSDDEAAF